ncbi:MAG: 2-C-methyl-D-erythritol 2,4-cyclodiphosphate synthase [Chloroflexota bacterium]|nr:2-C-methyl-D-erythritol 2,4-cyclodiphosphate synthase [Chloroflexota bacterium]
MSERLTAVLVAAGRSRRMGVDKLWIDLWGRPAWRWSLDALLSQSTLTRVAVVVAHDRLGDFTRALPSPDRCLVLPGGEERADSVLAGLRALADDGADDRTLVLVHDAARPAASRELVARIVAAAPPRGGVVPVVPVQDTLLRGDGMPLDRDDVSAVQTPQLVRLGELRGALEAGGAFTDDVSALASTGLPVVAVRGEVTNRKLTEPGDEEILRGVLRARSAPLDAPNAHGRAGIGFDAHRLEAGRGLRLGGLDWPHEPRGLLGHSDGDVALHAVIDALLGAAGMGDIGAFFPSDGRSAGAHSSEMLRLAVERMRVAGWRPTSVDLTIVAAHPAIAPRRDEMAIRIAALVGLPFAAVTVKGTTSDGLGFAGEEGIAAYAVAAVESA